MPFVAAASGASGEQRTFEVEVPREHGDVVEVLHAGPCGFWWYTRTGERVMSEVFVVRGGS